MAIERQAYAARGAELFVPRCPSRTTQLLVARIDRDVVGYAGLICYGDEAHVTNIAVDPMLQATRCVPAAPGAVRLRCTWVERRVLESASRTARAAPVRSVRVPPGGIRATTTPSCTKTADHVTDDVRTEDYALRLESIAASLERSGRRDHLGIETSCDETPSPSSRTRSTPANLMRPVHLHERFGGSSEVAARAHVEASTRSLRRRSRPRDPVGTSTGGGDRRPGLVGALLVGWRPPRRSRSPPGAADRRPPPGGALLGELLEHGPPEPRTWP